MIINFGTDLAAERQRDLLARAAARQRVMDLRAARTARLPRANVLRDIVLQRRSAAGTPLRDDRARPVATESA
jgi:hypothetical protein